jgi:outer membrane protein assembly factor BamB
MRRFFSVRRALSTFDAPCISHSLRILHVSAAAVLVASTVACGQAVPNEPPSQTAASADSGKAGVDWPRFLGPTADGKSPETGLIVPWPAEGPRLVWQVRLGTGYGAPTVSRGKLYQFDRQGPSARVHCLNAATGESIWKFEYPTTYEDLYGYDNGPRCSPIVDGDLVYAFGVEGMLYCLKADDGKVVWKVDTAKDFGVIQNFFGVGSTPVVEGDLLIVQIGGSPPEAAAVPPGRLDLVRGNGSGIVAFDKLTGQVRYKLSDELASYAVPVMATIDGRRYGFAFTRGGLLAFEPASGRAILFFTWRAEILESVNASNPVVAGNLVLISETYGPGAVCLCVKGDQYEVVWSDEKQVRDKRLQTHWNTSIHVDGYVYGSSGRHTGNAELRCVELATGNVKWSEPELTRSSLTYVDGHFICLTEYGELLLIKANPSKFDLVSRVTPTYAPPPPLAGEPYKLLNYPAWASPVVSHGLMYARGEGRLACFEIMKK